MDITLDGQANCGGCYGSLGMGSDLDANTNLDSSVWVGNLPAAAFFFLAKAHSSGFDGHLSFIIYDKTWNTFGMSQWGDGMAQWEEGLGWVALATTVHSHSGTSIVFA